MSISMSRAGVRLPAFEKHCASPKFPLHSPTTVLSPESSTEFISRPNSAEQQVDSELKGRRKTPIQINDLEEIDSRTWLAATGWPSDLLVEVDDISFHLHKQPILSRSGLLNRLASLSSDPDRAYINLEDVPGSSGAFALAVKFCYGIAVTITPANVAAIRCAAEYLEMTEAFEEGNVSSKAQAFLDFVVLTSWQHSIAVLQTCSVLLPWAEDLQIVKRCSEYAAHKACTDPRRITWPFLGSSVVAGTPSGSNTPPRKNHNVPRNWWMEDVSQLDIFSFGKFFAAIKEKGVKADILGAALEYYVQKWLPGLIRAPVESCLIKESVGSPTLRAFSPTLRAFSEDELSSSPKYSERLRLSRGDEVGGTPTKPPDCIAEQNKNRAMLEEIVFMLPMQKDAVSCSFLLRMLRAACLLNCSSECKEDLEKRAGMQLEQGTLTLSDLLIPSFSHTSEYLYDVDLVRRILEHYLALDQGAAGNVKNNIFEKKSWAVFDGTQMKPPPAPQSGKLKVAKLLDSYLAEVARDSKLPLRKFQALAEVLPEYSRLSDDGLYRAVDTYLKGHPSLTEHDRKRMCRIIDCQRLSLDACKHAAQNDRLPLRFVVQVIFSEQLKLRNGMSRFTSCGKEGQPPAEPPLPREPTAASLQSTDTPDRLSAHQQPILENANRLEIRALQRELAAVRATCRELAKEQTVIQGQVGRISKPGKSSSSSWSSGWKKLRIFSHNHKQEEVTEKRDTTNHPPRWRNSIA